ncbi:glycosyltransferase [Phycisphaerales bacterium AB-hyl4]|uniref:Glycosyltransferase n=1 Tax=Natronomicrosphaera hydrolytica TaxID=3242702 RepID=A0ABV4U7N4_9BACT
MPTPQSPGVERADVGVSTDTVRVLHILAVSVPYLNGYTMRSRYVINQQRQTPGYHPAVITSPFYPTVPASQQDEAIDGVQYHRVPHPFDLPLADREWADSACSFCYRTRLQLRYLFSAVMNLLSFKWLRLRMRPRLARVRLPINRGLWKQRCMRAGKMVGLPTGYELPTAKGNARSIGNANIAESNANPSPASPAVEQPATRTTVTKPTAAKPKPRRLRAWLQDQVGSLLMGMEEVLLLRRFEREIIRVARIEKPHVLHAHSPYRCGVPAARAAKKLGIPLVYEVRGLWEESGVAQGNFTEGSKKYRFWKMKETEAIRRADVVVAICEQLREEVIRRGVDRQRTFVVPNAVDEQMLTSDDTAEDTADAGDTLIESARWLRTPASGATLGYVGSLRKLEGVDELVRAVGLLHAQGENVSLLIVGDGPELPQLRELAEELGIADRSVFTGRVPHDSIQRYYELIDVFVISRPPLRVAELVTPLKPLEAMGLGRALVMPRLASLCEIVREEETGLMYEPANVDDLARQCKRLMYDDALRDRLSQAAKIWVRDHRTWTKSLEGLVPAYDLVLSDRSAKQTASP